MVTAKLDRPPSLLKGLGRSKDTSFAEAAAAAMNLFTADQWNGFSNQERSRAIYAELRRMDLARVQARSEANDR